MAWIKAPNEYSWIASVYRHAVSGELEQFHRWALEHLRSRVSFQAAIWCIRPADRTAPLVHMAFGLDPAAQQQLLQLSAAAWLQDAEFGPGARSIFSNHRLADLADTHENARELYDLGLQHVFVCLSPHEDPRFSTEIYLLRAETESAWSLEDYELLRTLIPHLAEAEPLVLNSSLEHNTPNAVPANSHSLGGVRCLCDTNGRLVAAGPGFCELVRRHLPQWDGLHLPFALPPPSVPETNGHVRSGLHIEVTPRGGGLLEILLRSQHPFDRLTEREHEIIDGIICGHRYKTIARQLGVSASTVANHACKIYRKLGARGRDHLIQLRDQPRSYG